LLPFHCHHVRHRYSFVDADYEIQPAVHSFHTRLGGKGSRNIDGRSLGSGFVYRFTNRVENRDPFHFLSAFSGSGPAHDTSSVFDGLLRMKQTVRACNSLRNHFCILVDENTQDGPAFPFQMISMKDYFTKETIFSAASAMESAAVIFKPDSFRIFLPCSTLVPSRRTTKGRSNPTS